MAIAKVAAESPDWLHTLAQIAGVLLLLELGLVLIIVCALMIGMAFGARWLHVHVVPVLREYTPRAQQAMEVTRSSTDRAVTGIAEFYGWRQRVETTLRVLFLGRREATRTYEDAAIRAASQMQMMDSDTELAGADADYAPEAGTAAADREGRPADRPPDQFNTLAGNAG